MDEKPLLVLELSTVTVCIPTIPPRKQLLERALASVSRQTCKPQNVIIVEDTEGEGAAVTRNRAWQEATTKYVAFLDDDDEFMANHLEICVMVAERTNADLVYPWFKLVGWSQATDERPDPLATMFRGDLVHPLGVPFGPEQETHYRQHAFIPITTLVRRSMLERSGGFPRPNSKEWPLPDCEDWGGWLRLLDVGARFVHAPERTWICHLDSTKSTAGKPWTSVYAS